MKKEAPNGKPLRKGVETLTANKQKAPHTVWGFFFLVFLGL